MRYYGGKSRIAKPVCDVIGRLMGNRTAYIEPFVGGGSILSRVARMFETVVASDINPSLILLWNKVVFTDWWPSEVVEYDEWLDLRHSVQPSAEKAWAGIAASYNGRWFTNYGARSNSFRNPRDYVGESSRSLDTKVSRLVGHPDLKFLCADYSEVTSYVRADAVVYCDPPYIDTRGYGGTCVFNTEEFWRVADMWADEGALVLVHEFVAPSGWSPVLSNVRVSTADYCGNALRRMEKLWVRDVTNGRV